MCGSKKKTQAIEPNSTTPRSSRTDPPFRSKRTPEPSRTPKKTSISEPSTSYGVFTTGSTSGTSSSSRASLASLRSSLLENPHIYDFSEIRKATNNFLTKRFSTSSSTSSWRCQIRSKEVIVIQRRFRRSIETSELRELLSVICKGHHSTIIKLLGASVSGNNIYLVYEFVNGANLAVCLRNPKTPDYTILSNWMSRMQIATDLAQGLEYIHHYTGLNLSLVHNHIKSTSVIVTEDPLRAKICHFGTSELCGEITGHAKKQHQEEQKQNKGEITEEPDDQSSATPLPQLRRSDSRAMRLQGTRGYMSPEFQSDGIGTQKSDVYAFGVVILELLSGEEPLKYRLNDETGEFSRVSVIQTASLAVGSGDTWGLRRWVDRRLRDSYPVEVAEKLTRLALECVDVEPQRRPDMRHVAGVISKLLLESKTWVEKMGAMPDFTISLGPR